jgi:hypothetical protein
MKKNLKLFGLILFGLTIFFQTNTAQTEAFRESDSPKTKSLFSSGLHTLSIHVRDSITHDSVFHFLVDKLKLPIYYYPAGRNIRFAGVYAGNLVLEPCGPHTNKFPYASNDFRAIFFGLTFEPFESISQSAISLTQRKIYHQSGDTFIYFQKDSTLCGDNMTISLTDRGSEKIKDNRIKDSLRYSMNADSERIYKVFHVYEEAPASYTSVNYSNELGIEYVKEICIGFKDSINLQKWKELISPVELKHNKTWKVSDLLEFKFVKSNIKEVQSITFKVKSLEKAKLYLLKNNLIGKYSENKIEINKKQAFGLSMYLTEED